MSEDVGPIAQPLRDQARSGDAQALGQLLESHRADLTVLAQVQIGRPLQGKVDVADVMQDAFLVRTASAATRISALATSYSTDASG